MHFMYLRDQNRFPHSCIAFQVDWDANVVSYGLSTVHPKDKNSSYKKALARDLAVGRMINDKHQLKLDEKCTSIHDIKWSLMSTLTEDKTLPKRVHKSVINWMLSSDKNIPASPPTQRDIEESTDDTSFEKALY